MTLSLSSRVASNDWKCAQSIPTGKASTVTAVRCCASKMYVLSTLTSVPRTDAHAVMKWRT